MKCTAFSMILAVPLLVGAVAVEPRDRLLAKLTPGAARTTGDGENNKALTIIHNGSFAVDEVVKGLGWLELHFKNRDLVKCELSTDGPADFYLALDAIPVGAELTPDGRTKYTKDNCTTFSFEGALNRSRGSFFAVYNTYGTGDLRVTGGCALTSKNLRGPAITKKDGTTQTRTERVELHAGSHAPFHLKKGVTSVTWDMSCINCTDDMPLIAYGLFETEQYKQLEAAHLLDEERDNNKPVSIECQSAFVDLRRNSTRVLPLKAPLTYTLVAVNYNDNAVTVSGSITTTSS